jgi:hypothetical protein
MKGKSILGLLSLAVLIMWGNAQEIVPVTVSPGSESGVAVVTQRCPTFSWSSIQWALGYRVAVFEATTAEVTGYEAMAAVASPILTKEIQGQALSWTPSARERLRNGRLYVWYVEALDASGQGVWSTGKVFEVEVEEAVGGMEERLAKIEERVGWRLKEKGVSDEVIADVAKEMESGITGGEIAGYFTLSGTGQNPGTMRTQYSEDTQNTIFGLEAGPSITTGGGLTFIGYRAGYVNDEGWSNTFLGMYTGFSNTKGSYNTFVGGNAGRNNIEANYNTFVGFWAGMHNTETGNTFIGSEAGYLNTTGIQDTFVGRGAGYSNSTAVSNTFLGHWAGYSNTTGNYNTYLGRFAGRYNQTGSGNVFLGMLAGYYETGSNKLYIDNSNTSSPLIYGDFSTNYLVFNGKVGVQKTNPTHLLDVGASGAYCNGGAWVDGSSREYKENIEELSSKEALRAFRELEPVKYIYKADKDEKCLGFIAEDVPELVATKDRKGLSPMDVVAVLTKVVQEQQKTIDELRKQVAELKRKMN